MKPALFVSLLTAMLASLYGVVFIPSTSHESGIALVCILGIFGGWLLPAMFKKPPEAKP